MAMYHWEEDQEDFLVLAGEAVLIVEGEERPLRAWDFVHCPPKAKHVSSARATRAACWSRSARATSRSARTGAATRSTRRPRSTERASTWTQPSRQRRTQRSRSGRLSRRRRLAPRLDVCHAAAEGRRVPDAPRGRAVRDPEPVGRRLCAHARGARLPGTGDDELGVRVHARQARRRGHARRGGRARRCARRRNGAPGLGRPRERLRRLGRPCGHGDQTRGCGGRRRRLDRGLGSRRAADLRLRPGGRAGGGGDHGCPRARLPVHVHGACRQPHSRP